MPNLVPLLCILPALRLAWAVRPVEEQPEIKTWNPEAEGRDPDAQFIQCGERQNELQKDETKSMAKKHEQLGQYTPDDIVHVRCDERVMVFLSRWLQRIDHLSHTIDYNKKEETITEKGKSIFNSFAAALGNENAKKDKNKEEREKLSKPNKYFNELFPVDYAANAQSLRHKTNAAESVATVATLGANKMFDFLLNIGLDAFSGYSYDQWLHQSLGDPERENIAILATGADLPAAPLWNDVPLGMIWDVTTVIRRRWDAKRCHAQVVWDDDVELKTSDKVIKLPKATFVRHLPQNKKGEPPKDSIWIQTGESNPDKKLNNQEGWVHVSKIAENAWFRAKKRLPICRDVYEDNCPEKERKGWVEKGEKVKIQSAWAGKKHLWQTCGEMAYISADPDDIEGPLKSDEAELEQELLEQALNISNIALRDGTLIAKFSDVWNGKMANHVRAAATAAFIVGGILSHGLLFLIAGLTYSLGTAATDSGVSHAAKDVLVHKVSYMLLSLLHWERELWEQKENGRKKCDVKNNGPVCDTGYTCIRQGTFLNNDETYGAKGWCVLSPWKELLGDGKECANDMDCKSGYCRINERSEQLWLKLSGTCVKGKEDPTVIRVSPFIT